ncbi:MAG: SGNH/GDSL hydrolase family protein [Flavobacterium sp.]
MRTKLKSFLALIFLNILPSCSQEDNINPEKTHITFSYNEENVPTNFIDLTKTQDGGIKMLIFNQDLYMQDMSLTTTFEILNEESISITTGKSLGYIRLHDDNIEIYKSNALCNSTELNKQFKLNSFLKKGIIYKIGFHKTNQGITFFLEGGGIIFEKNFGINEDFLQNIMRGKPYFEVELGNVRVHKSVITSNYDKIPKVSIYGDSFIEGFALYQYGLNLNNRWGIKLANSIGEKKCFLDGVGGQNVSKEWLNRLELENSWFKSEYVILSVGTNNYNDLDGYFRYMKKAINLIKASNQIPILVTLTPRPNYDYYSTAKIINDWILSSGEKYIDIHKAVTKEDDDSQWKNEFILPDDIHPSVAGYNAMYDQVKIDCPFLFN